MNDSMTARLQRPGAAQAGDYAMAATMMRMTGMLLALAVSVVHIADAGGITAYGSPHWMAWGYRFIEVGGVLTALALILPYPGRLARVPWLGWAAAALLGVVPFIGYVASRTIGVPGDHADVGNWGYWLGTVSLIVEAALIMLAASMLLPLAAAALRKRRSRSVRGMNRA
jgi:hypothetical protein